MKQIKNVALSYTEAERMKVSLEKWLLMQGIDPYKSYSWRRDDKLDCIVFQQEETQ